MPDAVEPIAMTRALKDPPDAPTSPAVDGPESESARIEDAETGRRPRSFLAGELGGEIDEDGEIVGAKMREFLLDPDLRALGMRCWQQMKGRAPADAKNPGEAGPDIGDLFAPGMTEFVTSSSTAEELERYRTKLAFRADLLEALLKETLSELEALAKTRPSGAGET